MSHPSPAIPPPLHREAKPVRSCSKCGGWLSTGNETDLCWAHGKTWSIGEATLTGIIRDDLADALDAILTTA